METVIFLVKKVFFYFFGFLYALSSLQKKNKNLEARCLYKADPVSDPVNGEQSEWKCS